MTFLGGLVAPAIGALVALAGQFNIARADELVDFVGEKAAVVSMLNARVQRAVATIAQDRFVLQYAVATRDDVKQVLKAKVESLLTSVSASLFAEEIAIVKPDGRPIARLMRGEIDDESDLDAEDKIAIEEASRMDVNTVYASPIYRSPEGEWVISYAAPVQDNDEPYAILHVEQNLRRKLDVIAIRPADHGIRWYIVEDGIRTVFDSEIGTLPLRDSENTSAKDFFSTFSIGNSSVDDLKAKVDPSGVGVVIVDGTAHEIALKTVDRWTIVAVKEAQS